MIALLSSASRRPPIAGVLACVFACVLTGAIPCSAQPKEPKPVRVTVAIRDSTVKYVVDEIARQAHLRTVYGDTRLLDKRISLRVTDAAAADAIAAALKGTGLIAKMAPDGQTVMIRAEAKAEAKPEDRPAQQRTGTIMGFVGDTASIWITGATVSVQGTNLSTVSGNHGQFQLRNVPVGARVVAVRAFGFRPSKQVVTVSDSAMVSLQFFLGRLPTVLSGVVTTAAGEQKRLEVGNDITVLNVDSIQQIAPVTNVTQLLEGRVPGLIVMNTSGIPGAPSRLRLRGASSIRTSNDPIVIVDGVRVYADQSGNLAGANTLGSGGTMVGGGASVAGRVNGGGVMSYAAPSPIDQIDPNSIETIQVMKGPSASSLYGSDAANGVIVITTKRGRPGPTHWNVATDLGRTTLSGDWPTSYYRFGHAIGLNNSGSLVCSVYDGPALCALDSVVAFQALNDPRFSTLDKGYNQAGSVTVSGGSGSLSYSVTGSGTNQTGYLHLPSIVDQDFRDKHGFEAPNWMKHPDHYTTWGANSRLEVALGAAKVTSISLTNSVLSGAQQQSSLQSSLGSLSSRYIDATHLETQPLISEYYERAQLASFTTTSALSLNNWTPIRWLPITATAGLNTRNTDNSALTPRNYILETADSMGRYAITRGNNLVRTLDVRTTVPSRFINTSVGLNVHAESQDQFSASTTGLPVGVSVPTSFSYPNGGGPQQLQYSTSTYGWYVQPTLNINSRFFVSPGFRFDGGSASGDNAGLSFFPKIDVSFIALQRPDDPLFGAITLIRPRLAFGVAGVAPSPGDRLRLLAPTLVIPGGSTTPVEVLQLSTLGNTDLHPERSRELEGGVDLDFWNQRLSLSLTGYHKTRYDAILQIPLAPSAAGGIGGASIAKNIGTIRNTGLEASVNATMIDETALQWTVSGNVSRNRNRVITLVNGQEPILFAVGQGYQTRITPGYPTDGLWARPILSYADINGDGIIAPGEIHVGDSAVYLGQGSAPNYQLALSTGLALFNGRLRFNTALTYQNGLTQTNIGGAGIISSQLNNPESSLAQQAAIAAIHAGPNATGFGLIQTVNTLRWQTLAIGYVVPPRTAQRLFRVPAVSLTFQGSNLGLHTNYRGKDPNVNAFTNGDQTVDTGGLPEPRVFSLRVTLGN